MSSFFSIFSPCSFSKLFEADSILFLITAFLIKSIHSVGLNVIMFLVIVTDWGEGLGREGVKGRKGGTEEKGRAKGAIDFGCVCTDSHVIFYLVSCIVTRMRRL